MKFRIVDVLLVIVILTGGVFAWKTGREHSRLMARYNRLASITGDLKITDPTKVYIQVLETEDPMQFAWRMYFPPKYRLVIDSSGNGGTGLSRGPSGPSEFIGRLRFRANERGDLAFYARFDRSTTGGLIAWGPIERPLKDHWKELHIEQLGTDKLTVVDPADTVTMLRITLPDELQTQLTKQLGHPIPDYLVPVLYELKLGPNAAKPTRAARPRRG